MRISCLVIHTDKPNIHLQRRISHVKSRVVTKRADDYSGYVEHPRYGRGPRITGLNPSDQPWKESVFLHWHSGEGIRIPNTAIVANTDKQLPATIPVTHYFDSKRVCRRCRAYFIFFAEEQRYWYEELRFPLDADMVECACCRKHERKLKEARQEYEDLMTREERGEEETLRLVENGLFLVEEGVFSSKVLSKFRGLLNALEAVSPDVIRTFKQRITTATEQHDS